MKLLFKLTAILIGTLSLLGIIWSNDYSAEVSDNKIIHGIKK